MFDENYSHSRRRLVSDTEAAQLLAVEVATLRRRRWVVSVKVVEIGVEFGMAIGQAARGGSLSGSASSSGGVSSAIPSICI